jgi:hypothetical protein
MACGRTAHISYRLHVDELISSLLLCCAAPIGNISHRRT